MCFLVIRILLLDAFVQLLNAKQSGTFCHAPPPDSCTAEKAIDKDEHSMSSTLSSEFSWWSVELASVATIKTILVSTNRIVLPYFRRFKVETRVLPSDPWKVCKGEHSMQSPRFHMVQCENVTVAGYVRLSVAGFAGVVVSLMLYDVKVTGSPTGKV